MDFATERFHGFVHAARFGDGNNRVIPAMKNPYWRFADFLGGFRIRRIVVGRLRASLVRHQDSPADGYEGREFSGILSPKIPGSVAAHGKARQISSRGIAMKLLLCVLQRGHGDVCHGIRPKDVFAALRHHHNGGEAVSIPPNRRADTDLGLEQAVISAFTGAVKKQDDWPLFLFCPIVRNEYLVFVLRACYRDGAIEEAGFSFLALRRRTDQRSGNHRQKKEILWAFLGKAHDSPPSAKL